MTTRRIGILGGTFDPIHCGHLDLGAAAESALGLTEVVVIAASVPPHRPPPAASSYHRFAMVALALSGRDRWIASDVELEMASTSFTADTLHRFHHQGFPASELFFLVGADAFAEIETWKDFPELLDLAHFAAVSRPGFHVNDLPVRLPGLAGRMSAASAVDMRVTPSIFLIDAPTADVSSTAIRQRCAVGQSIAGLVPPMVRQHIERHQLYSAAIPEDSGPDSHRAHAAGRLHGQD